MFHDVLMDGFDQRIIGHGLHKYRSVIVSWGGGHVHLQGQTAVLLQHLVVDVLNGFEPGHFRIMNVVCFIVEDGQLLDFADNFPKIGLTVGGLAEGPRTEGREKVIAQVVVIQRGIGHIAKKDPVDVAQEEIPCLADNSHIVLDMQGKLEIVAPVMALVSIIRQNRVIEENRETIEIRPQAVEHDDIWRDNEEVARQRGIRLVEFVKEAPGNEQGEDFSFSGAGGHF